MATYGEGEPTDNAVGFAKWLKGDDEGAEAIPEKGLAHVRFTVFGLGNRQYEHYNAMGKLVDSHMERLGATRMHPYGEGDDDANLEDDFDEWRQDLWKSVRQNVFGDDGGDEENSPDGADVASLLAPPQELQFRTMRVSAPAVARDGGTKARHLAWDALALRRELKLPAPPEGVSIDMVTRQYYSMVPVRVMVNEELRQEPSDGNSTRHIELDLKGTGLRYDTADNLSVLPANDSNTVEAVCRWMDWDPDEWILMEPVDGIPGEGEEGEEAGGASSTTQGSPTAARARGNSRGSTGDGTSARPRQNSSQRPAMPPFPTPCTVRAALSWFCDLEGAPPKAFVAQLAHFANKSDEQLRLATLASPQGRAEWNAWGHVPRRSVWEVLQAFPSCRPSLGAFLELCPRLRPRDYTIASSAKVYPDKVHLAVSVVDDPKPAAVAPLDGGFKLAPVVSEAEGSRRLRGVCSQHMARTVPPPTDQTGQRLDGPDQGGSRPPWPVLWATVRSSTFSLPRDTAKPVLLVGPGTGIAPMRAFLQERRWQREQGLPVGRTILFFGCRNPAQDYIYRDELQSYVDDGTLTKLHTAFSRTQAHKIYVQNRLVEAGAEVWPLLTQEGACVYVCGATRMGHDVQDAFSHVAREQGGMTREAGLEFVRRLEREGRYIQELWS